LLNRFAKTSAPTRGLAIALFVPIAIYLAVSFTTNLNLGVRHVLPILPLGVVAAVVVGSRLRGWKAFLLPACMVLTAVESLAATPNFIAFFNQPSRVFGAPVDLLGDSNLDWGQDLPALAAWRADHLDRPLYLDYFGLIRPESFGIDYRPLSSSPWHDRARLPDPARPAWVAITASKLQGIESPGLRPFLKYFRAAEPAIVLNGTIFIYDWPLQRPPPMDEWRKLYEETR
jgi:hypothetical protein